MKAFCEECRDYTIYHIEEIERTKDIKNIAVNYVEKRAYCSECKNEMFVSELRDENLKALDQSYRSIEGLISISEIEGILEKYHIGKRPMSLLLGWGETTLTRFLNGDMPSKTYSDLLKRINESADFFLNLLMRNKDSLTETAYKKCFEATNLELKKTYSCTDNDKIESACNYIIGKSIEITPLALQKLLYFSQAFHKVFMGKFMFEENCEAWVHGPVYRDVYYKYKDHGFNPIEDHMDRFECFNLSESEREVISAVINYFGCYSGKILESMTHNEPPWKVTRIGLDDEEMSNIVIKKDLIEKYFSEVHEKYNMLNIADIKDYAEDMFSKIRH